MPIDPSIALGVKQPQFDNPLDLYGKALGVAGAQQNMALNRERLQTEQLANQKAQMAVKDQEITRQAYSQAVQAGTPKAASKIAAQMGASADAVTALDKHFADLDKTYAEIDDKKLATQKYTNELTAGLISKALNDPNYEQNEAAYREQAAQLHPDWKDKLTQPIPKDQLSHLMLGVQTDAQLIKEQEDKRAAAKEARDAAKAPSELTSAQNAAAASEFAVPKAQAEATTAQQAATGTQPITPYQKEQLAGEAAGRAESARHNLSSESTAKINAAVASGRLKQEQMVNGLKYGPDTVEFWAKQLQDNPDSVKELPSELKTKVGQAFRQSTGLPLPTALSGPVQQQETAARNALDNIEFIRNALKNPEIRKQIGPIMGRLGNAEQALGTAAGLSPEAAQLAQELRTRMRYFVFQEGKAVLGGRLPQQLMGQLESSSANPKMDPNLLEGALKGAEGSASGVIDNADRQRFGGAMRPKEMRRGAASSSSGPKEITDKAEYDKLPVGAQYTQNGVIYTKK